MASTSSARCKRRAPGVLGVALALSAHGWEASAQNADGMLRRASAPGVAFQVAMCLDDGMTRRLNKKLEQGFRTPSTPRPDVRTTCSHGRQNFGIWLEPVPGAAYPVARSSGQEITGAARDRGLEALDILVGDEMFAWSVGRPFMQDVTEKIWAGIDRRYGSDGRPSRNGATHLRSLSLNLLPPASVRLTLAGWYDTGVSVDFHVRLTDTLALKDGWVTSTGKTRLDIDDQAALVGLGILAEVLFPPIAVSIGGAMDDGPKLDTASNRRLGDVLASASPTESMDAGGTKTVYQHTRLGVTEDGVVAGGSIRLNQPRQPAVTISGPDALEFATDQPALGQFTAETYDLRAAARTPLVVQWASRGTVAQQGARATSISFPARQRRGSGRGGQLTTEVVTVTVTDADGLTATARKTVTLRDLRGDPPAICVQKPYLPQCRPVQRRPRR